jgi:hypothetical protein
MVFVFHFTSAAKFADTLFTRNVFVSSSLNLQFMIILTLYWENVLLIVGLSIRDKYSSILYSFLNVQKKDSLEELSILKKYSGRKIIMSSPGFVVMPVMRPRKMRAALFLDTEDGNIRCCHILPSSQYNLTYFSAFVN